MDFMVLIQLFSAIAQIFVALVMLLSVYEIRKDRKRGFLEKRLEEFYIPLINLFGHGGLVRDPEKHRRVEEIIVSRRYLCGKGFPRSCRSTSQPCQEALNITSTSAASMRRSGGKALQTPYGVNISKS
jgi:hypothetical protein